MKEHFLFYPKKKKKRRNVYPITLTIARHKSCLLLQADGLKYMKNYT